MALIVLDSKDGASDFVVRGWIRATAQREHLHREIASVEEGSTSNPRGLALSLVSLSQHFGGTSALARWADDSRASRKGFRSQISQPTICAPGRRPHLPSAENTFQHSCYLPNSLAFFEWLNTMHS